MKYSVRLGVLLSLLSVGVGCSDIENPEKAEKEFFVPAWAEGAWQYQNSEGQKVTVKLYNDGSVLGSDDAIGSWYSVESRVYITWMSGWTDVLMQKGSGYEKLGFAPGVATDNSTTNKSQAIKLKK